MYDCLPTWQSSVSWSSKSLFYYQCSVNPFLSLTGEIVTQPPTTEPPTTSPITRADIGTDVTASQGGTEPSSSGSDNTATVLGPVLGGIIAVLVLVIMVLVVIVIVVIVCTRL